MHDLVRLNSKQLITLSYGEQLIKRFNLENFTKRVAMSQQEQAETLALEALAWLAQEEDLLNVFLGSSGLSEADLRMKAGDPNLLAAVLDFVLMDDTWVIKFCDSNSMPYDRITQARAALPGGEQVHWT